jgi:ribonuclease R
MKTDNLKEQIGALLARGGAKALSASEIAVELKLHGKMLKQLQKWLNEMVVDGDIVRIRQNRYALGLEADLVTGVLTLTRSGNGFVNGTGGSLGMEVFVRSEEMGTALPGDKVVARIEPAPLADRKPGRGPSGKVIRIIERARRDIVGTLRKTERFLYVVPIDPVYKQDFYVPDAAGASVNDRVVIRFTSWANRHVSPEAEIVECLGPEENASADTLAVIRHFGLRDEWPEEVIREAEAASALMDKPGQRLDLRGEYILTIDPVRARDFDDALSLKSDEDGNRELGVHIADVCHFVRPGGALDTEALERGNSVYFADRVLPMLPEQLSNGVCSLRPDEDRLAFSVFMTVDRHGNVRKRRFARTIIRSRLRLSYEQAFAALQDRMNGGRRKPQLPEEAVGLLLQLHELAQQLRANRFQQHAMDLDMPECEVQMTPDGLIAGLKPVENDISHQLVEECMVAANEAVAAELANRGVPLISRLHESPNEDKIEELIATLSGLGYEPGNLHYRGHMAGFLKKIKDDPLAHHVRMAVLRSMKRALYSAKETGHFGLAKKYYAHFTSPIRRYPDLTVHRQLAAVLAAPENESERRRGPRIRPVGTDQLERTALHCSQTEQTADEAERALLEIKKYRYLAQQIEKQKPETYDAVITAVTNFGMFVELIQLQVQGLVHISAISDQFVRFNRNQCSLEAGKVSYKLGGKVRVIPCKVDFDKRKVDFTLVK